VAQGRRRELDSFLRKLGTCLRDLHDAVADNYFAAPARLRPLAGFQDPEPTDR